MSLSGEQSFPSAAKFQLRLTAGALLWRCASWGQLYRARILFSSKEMDLITNGII